jgi:hypothetical protein
MKRWIWVLLSLMMAFSVERSMAVDFKVSTGFNYDWWEDTKDNKARQSYTPLWLEARYKDFSLSFLTGYCYTHGDPSTRSDRSLSHTLDSKVNLSYEIVGKLPVDIMMGLDFNLPTGKTDLKAKDQILLMDPYLISINTLGEGFNINPTLSLAKEWGKWVFGMGIGYLWRGKYNFGNIRETPYSIIQIEDYSPGDIFNLTAEICYDISSQWHSRLFGNYVWYEEANWKESYRDIYGTYELFRHSLREGELWLLGMGLNYTRKKWDADLAVKGIFRDKNKYDYRENWYYYPGFGWSTSLTDLSILNTERENIHGDEWVGDLTVKYFLDDKTTLKSIFQALFITSNDYPSFSRHYQGRREKYSLGFGATRALLTHLDGEVYFKGFVMHDGERNYPYLFSSQTLSERHYKGFSGGLMLTSRF